MHASFPRMAAAGLAVIMAVFAAGIQFGSRSAGAMVDRSLAESAGAQFTPPGNLSLADLDGDGNAEFLQYGANKLFGFRADFAGTPMLHHYYRSDITRLIVGHFATTGREHERDDVCAILASGELNCAAPSPDASELWWWFTQPSFVGA